MNNDTLSQAKAYARQFLLEGTIRNHDLFLNTCIELKQRAGDPEASELLRKLNELESSYTTQPLKEDAEHMVINCGACSHQYRVRKGQGVITSDCPSCGRQTKIMTGEESITFEKTNANITVTHKLTISQSEAVYGTRKLLTLRGKHLEVTIPAGVKTGTQVRLSGALQITDGYSGDILIQIKVQQKAGIRHEFVWATLVVVLIIGLIAFLSSHTNQNNSVANTPTHASNKATLLTTAPSNNTNDVGINQVTGKYHNFYLGLAEIPGGGKVGGDGCYDDTGDFIVLINNSNAINPTYSQLISFLKSDKTDEYPYSADVEPLPLSLYFPPAESHVDLTRIKNIIDGIEQPSNPRICCDFAERLHNDAEIAGIKCAYVAIKLTTAGHAIVAFQTSDKGLIYIDDTGSSQEPHPLRSVKTVNLSIGSEFIPVSLFPEKGWKSTYESIGTVIDMEVEWDGTWNN